MTYVIAEPCVDVKDKACLAECPVDCIYEGNRTLYINPNAENFEPASTGQGQTLVTDGDHRVVAQLPQHSSQKKDIARFGIRKEEAADVDLWFPS